jgi:hypothetical protein
MVKYLKIKSETILENFMYKMFPRHQNLLEIQDLSEWMINRINTGFIDSSEFSKLNFNEKLSFKGLVKFPDHYETPNGILIDIENKKTIRLHLDNFYKNCIYLEDIFPEIEKIYKFCPEVEIDGLYTYIDINKKFPDFTDEEWNNFTEQGLLNGGLEWTQDV